MTTKRGGYRPNSGAKPKPPEEVASVRIVANVTPAEAAEWQRRGRTTWLRSELRRIESEVIAERDAALSRRVPLERRVRQLFTENDNGKM